MEFNGSGSPLSIYGLKQVCDATGVDAAAIWSILFTETSGCGFLPDKRPKILFERHVFHRLTDGRYDADDPDVSAPQAGGYGSSGDHQYIRLLAALQLDETAALQSASWGLPQIMGENYRTAGYDSVQTMVSDFTGSEDAQLLALAKFLSNQSGWLASLKSHDWPAFARLYNGPNYAANNYDGHLRAFCASFTDSAPDMTVRSIQVLLSYRGFAVGGFDGVLGPNTTAAIDDFLTSVGGPPLGANPSDDDLQGVYAKLAPP